MYALTYVLTGGNKMHVELLLGKLTVESLKYLSVDGEILLKQVTKHYSAIELRIGCSGESVCIKRCMFRLS
jgi:hypothetical protein